MHDYSDFDLNSADGAFQEGMDLLESDHFEEALHAFDFVLRKQPTNADALFHRGIALISLNRVDEAAAAYKSALDEAPTEPAYHSHYGYALMRGGNADEAIEHFDFALNIQPTNYQTKVYKACALAAKRNLGQARTLLEEVLDERPNDFDVLRHYGGVLSLLDEDARALQVFAAILAQNPNHLETLGRKTELHIRAGRYALAIRTLREAVALKPADLIAYQALVDLVADHSSSDVTIAIATEAIQAGHEDAHIHLHRARAYMDLKQTDQAITDLRRARDLDANLPDSHFLLACIYSETGRLRPALASIGRALHLSPDDERILLTKAHIHHRMGEFAQERRVLRRLMANHPDEFDVHHMVVRSLTAEHRYEDALQILLDFLARNPAKTTPRLLAAELADKCGRADQAREMYEKVFRFCPATPVAYISYATFLMRHNDFDHASGVLANGVARHPRDAHVMTAYAAALQGEGRHEEVVGLVDRFFAATTIDWPEAMLLRGHSLHSLGRHGEALDTFQRARTMEGRLLGSHIAPPLRFLIAEAHSLHSLGRTDEAITLIEQNFQPRNKSAAEIFELLGELHELVGELERAYEIFSDGLRRFPRNAALHYRASRTATALRKKSRALKHLATAAKIDPTLKARAAADPVFRPYWISPAFVSLVGKPLLTQPTFIGTAAAAVAAVSALAALALALMQ